METLTNKRQHGDDHKQTLTNKRQRRSASTAAAGPCYLLLNSCIDDEGSDSSAPDAKTTAPSCTSSGNPFSISFGIVAPPASCSLYFNWLGGDTPGDRDGKQSKSEPEHVRVIAGHDDALLIQLRMRVLKANVRRGHPGCYIPVRQSLPPTPTTTTFDDHHFLYKAGEGARRLSLLPLPRCNIPVQNGYRDFSDPTPRFRYLHIKNTGIIRRGNGDLVVCQYEMTCDPPIYGMADLSMLRVSRDRDWTVKRVPIVEHRKGSSELQPWRWQYNDIVADIVVRIGNRFLCWVDYSTGFVMCDLAEEEISKLRYTRRPVMKHRGYCGHYPSHRRAYCGFGAAGPDAVRFVSISPPRCCCGDFGDKPHCEGSSSSFNVTTWTMTLSMEEPTTWVKDSVLNCDEIWKWQLPNNGCLPRDKHLEYPMVSSDDPDVIYFKVEGMAVAINTRSKKLLSVVPSGVSRDDLALRHQRSITAKLCLESTKINNGNR